MDRIRVVVVALVVLGTSLFARAQNLTGVEISGNSLSAQISFPGGVAADLEIAFDEVLGLSLQNLGLSVELINPTDPALLARLPDPKEVSPAGAFPLLLRIEPPALGPLSFRGVASIELHTHQLHFTANCPLRLFKAPAGGSFQDITESMGLGSYRVRGSTGGFSDFLILTDLRALDEVIVSKFDRLAALLDASAGVIPEPVLDQLQDRFDAALSAYAAGLLNEAADEVEAFGADVRQHGGSSIPDVWRSARDLVNLAGELRSAAATLGFSLLFAASSGS